MLSQLLGRPNKTTFQQYADDVRILTETLTCTKQIVFFLRFTSTQLNVRSLYQTQVYAYRDKGSDTMYNSHSSQCWRQGEFEGKGDRNPRTSAAGDRATPQGTLATTWLKSFQFQQEQETRCIESTLQIIIIQLFNNLGV